MLASLSLTEAQIFGAIRGFIASVLPPGVEVLKAQGNRVPEPRGGDFVVMTPLFQRRLATNETDYYDAVLAAHISAHVASFIGSITPSTASPGLPVLAVTVMNSGLIQTGGQLQGGGIAPSSSIVSQIDGDPGGIGSYYVTPAQIVPRGPMVEAHGIMHIYDAVIGEVAIGASITDALYPNLVAAGTIVTAQIFGHTGQAGDYVITPIQSCRRETLYAGLRTDLAATQYTVQLDVHGPNSGNNVRVVETLFRSWYGVETIGGPTKFKVVPLYTGDIRQMPFINAEQQYEYRWTLDLELQANPIIGTTQQFFDKVTVTSTIANTPTPGLYPKPFPPRLAPSIIQTVWIDDLGNVIIDSNGIVQIPLQ